MIFRYTAPGRVSRRVTEALGFYAVVDDYEASFPAQLVVPNSDEASRDSAPPRDISPWRIRWRGGFQAPQGAPPTTGDRIEVAGVGYEITSSPRTVDEGRSGLVTYEVKCQPVNDLYPFVGEVQEMDGTLILPNVRFSAFRASEQHLDTGSYEDFDSEASVAYQDAVRKNRQIAYGTEIYRIVNVEIDVVGRYLRMSLRRSGG